jgi:hypothetical protein
MIKSPAQYRAGNRLQVTAHGGWQPVSRGRAGWRGGTSADGG